MIRSGPERPETAAKYREGSLVWRAASIRAKTLCQDTQLEQAAIVIDQKWKTGPISHVQFVLLVKVS